MNKKFICTMAVAALIAAAPTALAGNVNYIPGGANSVEVFEPGKKTVLITDEKDTIVYMNQSNDGFRDAETFLLKNGIADGKYTVKLGGGTNAEERIFYIGMQNTGIDVLLTKPTKDAVSSDGKNIGYTASGATGTYQTVIIQKSDNKYYGVALGTVISPKGAEVGIQINGVTNPDEISKVWLSERGIVTKSAETATE